MRRFGRIIAWFIIAAAGLVLVTDIMMLIDTGNFRPIEAGRLWYEIHPPSLNGLQAGIQRNIAPWLWDPVMTWILLLPAFVVIGVPGLILLILCRKRARDRYIFFD